MTEAPADWDVIVIGAGPAGAMAALLLARRGLQTLLVDKSVFPRDKVCGGCINQRAIRILRDFGIEQLSRSDSSPICQLRLRSRHSHADIALPPMLAISRSDFDAQLAKCAVDAGATFMPETRASVVELAGLNRNSPIRQVSLDSVSPGSVFPGSEVQSPQQVTAKIVLVADGLGHPSLRNLSDFSTTVAPHARIGLGTRISNATWSEPAEAISMAIGRDGYVGAVRLGSGAVLVAAAVSSQVVKRLGAAATIRTILEEASSPLSIHDDLIWVGTRRLNCRSERVADHRIFLLGDAMGYVEPFTGEGIGLALSSAQRVAPLVEKACSDWHPILTDQWTRICAREARTSQRLCRNVTGWLRRPLLTATAMSLLQVWPSLAEPFVRYINRPRQFQEEEI